MANPVFTIGHSNHTLEQFLKLLRQHEITAVADVRSVPHSRTQPQFNRESLKDALKGLGVEYVFLGKELGARTDNKSCYENGRVKYRRLAQTALFRSGLERLRKGGEMHCVALMCAEQEPLECHRTLLVARELEAAGTPVTHIHSDGHLESHADAVRRLLKLTNTPDDDFFLSAAELVDRAYSKQEERVAYVDDSAGRAANEAVP